MVESVDKRKIESLKAKKAVEETKIEGVDKVSEEISEIVDVGTEEMGNVSETATEKSKEKKGGTVAKGDDDDSVQDLKKELLAKMPTKREMRRQVEDEIKKEIKCLKKEAMKLVKSSKRGSSFELNNVVRKLRRLKLLLNSLFKVSVDRLKALWLRFVHGLK